MSAAQCISSDDEWARFIRSNGLVLGAKDGRDAQVAFRRACRLATGTNAAPMAAGPTRAWGTSVVLVISKLDVDGSSCNLIFFHNGLAANQDAPLAERLDTARGLWFAPRQRPVDEDGCKSVGAPVSLVRSPDEARAWVKSVKGTLLRVRSRESADVLLERMNIGGETLEQRAAHGGRSISTTSPCSPLDSNSSTSRHTPQSRSSGHASLYTPQSGQKMSQDSPFVDSPIAPTQGCVTEMRKSGAFPTVSSTDADASINDTVDATLEDSEILDTSSLSISLFGDNDMDMS